MTQQHRDQAGTIHYMTGVPMAEVTALAFLKRLMDRVDDITIGIISAPHMQPRTSEELERLSIIISKILLFVQNAEEKQGSDEAVRAWLRDLMDAAQTADGFLNRLTEPNSQKVSFHMFFCCLSGSKSSDMSKEISIIVKSFATMSRKPAALGLTQYLQIPSTRRSAAIPGQIIVSEQSGQWLEELKGFTELCKTELRLSELGNVNSRDEATQALLNQKKHLVKLELEWGWDYEWDGSPRGHDDEVLEGLQPHPHLQILIIRDNCGSKFPSWIEDNYWLSNLETLELHCCLTWGFTPLGKMPCLKHLVIDGSPLGRHFKHSNIDRGLGSVLDLQSYGTQGWEEREGEKDAHMFPNLQVLRISNCFRLVSLPVLPPTLTELYIDEVICLKTLPGLWGCNGITYSSLSSLHISGPHFLTTLEQGLLWSRLRSLESLTISSCSSLKYFPRDGLRSLVSLKSLRFQDCDKLTWLPESEGCLPSSLVDLKIIKCLGISIDSFFTGLGNLNSLSSLHIEGWELGSSKENHLALESLPGELLCHLTALTEMQIKNAPKLAMFGFQALPSLRRLKIHGCHNLHCPPLFESCIPPPLEFFEIGGSNIGFLTSELLHNLTSLQELRIGYSGPFDTELEKGLCCLASLKRLYIDMCGSLHWPDELTSLTSLKELYISDCQHLTFLPEKGFPASLEILVINNSFHCPALTIEKGDSAWHKIAHIPYVKINRIEIETEDINY